MAPELAFRAEHVRRGARDGRRPEVVVEPEVPGVEPDVRALVVHVDRDVADDPDVAGPAVPPQPPPLEHEDELEEPGPVHPVLQAPGRVPERAGLAPLQLVRPAAPGLPAEVLADGREEGEVVEPPGVPPAEPVEVPAVAPLHEPGVHPVEEPLLERDHPGEVDMPVGELFGPGEVRRGEEAVVGQQLRADQDRVLRKRGEAVVRVGVDRRVQGEDLPVRLPGLRKKVGEPVRRGPEVPDPEPRRQRRDMQEQPAPPDHHDRHQRHQHTAGGI